MIERQRQSVIDNGLWLTLVNGGLSALACGDHLGCKQEALYMCWFEYLGGSAAIFFLPASSHSHCFDRGRSNAGGE